VSKEKMPEEKQPAATPAEGESPAKPQKAEGAPKEPKGQKAEGAPKAQKGEGAPKGQKGQKSEKGAPKDGESKAKAALVPDPPGYKPRLKTLFVETIAKDLKEEFSYKSVMQIPKLSKIVVSIGLGEAIENKKLLDAAAAEIGQITGRKAMRTKAKKSIANFKVRQGMDVGAMVTLRGNVMYEFLDRLVNVAMPRIKDFRGVSPNAFDGHGNYSLGVTEQIIFPEIDYDKIERVSGMNIAVVTTARTDQEARSLLARLGMPFRK
jgi:large subunit ribosomal protein L5